MHEICLLTSIKELDNGKIKITFKKDFDVEKTYAEYVLSANEDELIGVLLSIFSGIYEIHCLHNCIIVKLTNLGYNSSFINDVKNKLNALDVSVAIFSPYIKQNVNGSENGLFYNIFFAPNCSKVKYPK